MSNPSENPYAAPKTTTVPSRQMKSDKVPWGIWISGAAASMILITATAMYLDEHSFGNIDPGPHSAMLAGLILAVVSVWIGRRYGCMSAIVLVELINLTTWLSMLLTVLVLSPILGDQKLRDDDYRIFAMIWAGGAVGTAVLVLLSSGRSAKQPEGLSDGF